MGKFNSNGTKQELSLSWSRATLAVCLMSIMTLGGTTSAESQSVNSDAYEYLSNLQKPAMGSRLDFVLRRTLSSQAGVPNTQFATHNIGNLHVGHTNLGQFGTGSVGAVADPVTGEQLPSAIFPANSNFNHLYVAAFWIGAIVGRDTLVSSGWDDGFSVREFWPGETDIIQRKTIIPSDPFYDITANSEQDFIATYYDTLDDGGITQQDFIDNRPHVPLNIKIEERSLQWSYDYASDFILFDYDITNVGLKKLEKVYMGFYVDGDVHHTSKFGLEAYGEDLCGFKQDIPAECGFADTVNIAYITDNNGDPFGDNWDDGTSVRSAAGVRLIRTPSDSLVYSFNWWSAAPGPDFGPRQSGTDEKPFRDMNSFLGAPHGDRNKYYVMSNGEFDYDQVYSATNQTADGWLPPGDGSEQLATGGDPKFMLSFGPFNIFPGETLPITFAYLAGADFHTNATDHRDLLVANPLRPQPFVETLNFTDLAKNSRWASWIYDNPGVDTDNDGYFGKFRVCILDSSAYGFRYDTFYNFDSSAIDSIVFDSFFSEVDTFFYEGDGVPDFLGASPPPAPILRILPEVGKLTIRWNGFESETTPDPFSKVSDFEGYRVYSSHENTRDQYSLQTSYDIEDYNRYSYDIASGRFQLLETPFTLDELRELYGPTFDPLNHGISNPLLFHDISSDTDSTFYFAPQDWNQNELNQTGTIRTRFDRSQLTKPGTNPELWTADDLTEDGFLKWYEYEYELAGLLPSTPIYVAVTAFDFGSPESGLSSLESSVLLNSIQEFPLLTADEAQLRNLEVIVYPNPYRIDGNYRTSGFEGLGNNDLPDERVRAVNFINLPRVCTISIFSLDGDLVRSIEHNNPQGGAKSMHEAWDLVTRNTQVAASGIYYYVIETPGGEIQTGKLILIM